MQKKNDMESEKKRIIILHFLLLPILKFNILFRVEKWIITLNCDRVYHLNIKRNQIVSIIKLN